MKKGYKRILILFCGVIIIFCIAQLTLMKSNSEKSKLLNSINYANFEESGTRVTDYNEFSTVEINTENILKIIINEDRSKVYNFCSKEYKKTISSAKFVTNISKYVKNNFQKENATYDEENKVQSVYRLYGSLNERIYLVRVENINKELINIGIKIGNENVEITFLEL